MSACFCYTAAQVICFPDNNCAGFPLAVGVDTPEDCCFVPSRGGRGAGSFASAGGDGQCIGCMTIIGQFFSNGKGAFPLA